MRLEDHIRAVPDFPKPGIVFRDIGPLLADAGAFAAAVKALAGSCPGSVDLVAGVDARGFIFGAAVARELGVGFLPVRKGGKLPGDVEREAYSLEYGEAVLEVAADLVPEGARVILVDDLIATGGTAVAAVELVRRAGGEVVHAAFVVGLPELMGVTRVRGVDVPVTCLVEYA